MSFDLLFDAVRRGLYALLSLVAGGLVAGVVMVLGSLFAGVIGLLIGIIAVPIWLLGMIAVGAPIWAILHACGHRSRKVARVAGAIGGGLAVFAVAAVFLGAEGYGVVLVAVITVAGALSGCMGANVVWTLAYEGRDAARA